jgi:hypothetical protein
MAHFVGVQALGAERHSVQPWATFSLNHLQESLDEPVLARYSAIRNWLNALRRIVLRRIDER